MVGSGLRKPGFSALEASGFEFFAGRHKNKKCYRGQHSYPTLLTQGYSVLTQMLSFHTLTHFFLQDKFIISILLMSKLR